MDPILPFFLVQQATILYAHHQSANKRKNMKYRNVLVALLIFVASVLAEEPGDVVILGDFDDTFQGFSFSRGELVTVDPDSGSLPAEISFIVDLPNGLGMNNSNLSDWFSGKALILDLGNVPLEESEVFPEGEFIPFLLPEEIIAGHTYLVKTGDTADYGMIRIVDFDSEKSLLTFDWIYVNK